MNLYYLIVVFSPVLALYGIGFSSITLFDLGIFLSLVSIIFGKFVQADFVFKNQASAESYLYVILIITLSVVHFIFSYQGGEIDSIMRSIKFLIYFLFPFMLFSSISDFNKFLIYFSYAALFVAIFLIIQYLLLFFTGYFLKGHLSISFLPILRPELVEFSDSITHYKDWIRLRSVLGEPSQIGIFVGLALFVRVYFFNSFFSLINVVLIIGLVMSFSTTSYAFIVASYVYYILRRGGVYIVINIFAIFAIFVLFLYYFYLNNIEVGMGRILKSLINRIGRDGFIESYENIFNLFFGYGYGSFVLEKWLPSISRILLSFGLIGFLMFIISIFRLVNIKSFTSIYFLLIYLFLSFGSEVPLSFFNTLYILIFLYLKKNSINLNGCKKEC